jgi:UDP-N-acetylmuramoyl-L-alanyl-D-glutamate--2,6-diaminopimelate ligase
MNAALGALQGQPKRPEPPRGPYLVAGLGRAGLAAANALARLEAPARVAAWDGHLSPLTEQARSKLRGHRIHAELGGDGIRMLATDPRPACIVKSPGIACDSPLLVEAARRGITVIDELELGWRLGRGPMIAVTGTNGKSTTASLVLAALQGVSITASLAGNSEFGPPLSSVPAETACVVCEVSSFQLEGCHGLLPECAVFTNLSRDHLHRHGTMARYGALKRRLFLHDGLVSPLSVVNTDSEFGRELADTVEKAGGDVVRFGTRPEADYRLEFSDWDLWLGRARIRTPQGTLTVVTRHPGEHNAANVTAAVALAGALGLDPEATADRLATACPVPGRFEPIDEGQPFDIVVDFAHNPGALRSVLRTARRIVSARPGARLIAVVSVPGTHDPPKRPEMGRVARRLVDKLVITTTNTYGEAPSAAVDGLLQGARTAVGAELSVAMDRREAIGLALQEAGAGDLVLVAGRGAIPTLRLDRSGAGPPFDDRVVVRELLAERTERVAA